MELGENVTITAWDTMIFKRLKNLQQREKYLLLEISYAKQSHLLEYII